MLTDEVVAASGEKMKIMRFITTIALFGAGTACTAERAMAPHASVPSTSAYLASGSAQLPPLFVVDGVRLEKDQVPSLSAEQVAAVRVIKGSAALRQYGQDAAYGVVIITTKQALSPTS
jgi:hypothetical protein